MPYHYVSQGNTIPLDRSPSCVIKALETLNSVVACLDNQLLQMPFNEALSICYLMGQKLNYHSDDEKGLGEVVASISLGNRAAMDFRPYTSTGHGARCLRLQLRHGDIVVMRGRSIQEAFQHRVIPEGFRISITARQIHSDHLGKNEASNTAVQSHAL